MLLKAEGKLHYDTLVSTYIPDFPYPGITVRHLLNHRSGLPTYMYLGDQLRNPENPFDNMQMHCMLEQHKPFAYAKPNKKFKYENSNYAYLALLVEYRSGMSFPIFLRDKIFEPLGMHDTRVFNAINPPDIPGTTRGHVGPRKMGVDECLNYLNGVVGDKGVYSTLGDLYKFDRALYSGKLLDEKTLEEAFFPGSPEVHPGKDNYGFGWRLSPFEQDKMVFHYGWWNGYKTCFMRFLKSERVIIALTNTDRRLLLPKEIVEFWWGLAPSGEESKDAI
jgi:CubicO group peptidase (beta-lactamase class C family)